MIGLIRKDIYYLSTCWKPLLLSILIIGGYATHKHMGALLILVFPLILGASIVGCIQNDAQKKWYQLNYVLPISLQRVVASRYLSFLSFVLLGISTCIVYSLSIESIMGLSALGKNFVLWQGLSFGLLMSLFFGAIFIPLTYYFLGEKMELCMMFSSLITIGCITLIMKLLAFLDISFRTHATQLILGLLVLSIILFALSWLLSNYIYRSRRKFI